MAATDVLATDAWSWNWPGSDARRNFELIRSVLDSGVRDQTISVEDLSPEAIGGPFDVVFFLGVLYHAPDPLGYLQRVRSVTGGLCVVETLVDLLEVPVPALAYYEGATLYGDASNNFGPNRLAVEAMLRDAGFTRVDYQKTWDRDPWQVRRRRPRWKRRQSGRMVFHAWV